MVCCPELEGLELPCYYARSWIASTELSRLLVDRTICQCLGEGAIMFSQLETLDR